MDIDLSQSRFVKKKFIVIKMLLILILVVFIKCRQILSQNDQNGIKSCKLLNKSEYPLSYFEREIYTNALAVF